MESFTNRLNHPDVQAILESLSMNDDLRCQQVTTSLKSFPSSREPLAMTIRRRNSAPSSGPRRLSTSSSECSLSPSPVSSTNAGGRSDSIHHPSLVGLEVVVLPNLLPRHIQASACMLGVIESSTASSAQVRLPHLAASNSISLSLSQIIPVIPQVGDTVTVIKGPLAGSRGVLTKSQDHCILLCGNKEVVVYDSSSLGKNHVGQLQNASSGLLVSDPVQRLGSDGGVDVLSCEDSPGGIQQAMSVCDSPSPAPSPFIPGLSPLQIGSGYAATNESSPESSISSVPTMSIAGDQVGSDDIAIVNGDSWAVSHASGNHVVSPPCHMTPSNTDSLTLPNNFDPDCLMTPSSHVTLRNPETAADFGQVSSTGCHMTRVNNSHVASDSNHLTNLGLDNVGSYFDTGCMLPASSYPMSVGSSSNFTSTASSYHHPASCSQSYADPHCLVLSNQDPYHHAFLGHPHPQTSMYDPKLVSGVHQPSNSHFTLSGAEPNNFSTVFSPRSSHCAYLSSGYPSNVNDLSSMSPMGMVMQARQGMPVGLNPRMYMHPRLASVHPSVIGMSPPAYRASHCQNYPTAPHTASNHFLNHQQPSPWQQQTHSQPRLSHSQFNSSIQTVPQPASKTHSQSKDFPLTPPDSATVAGVSPASFGKNKCVFFKQPSTKEHEELKKLCNSTKQTCRFSPLSRLCPRQPVRVPVLIEKVLNTLLQQEPPLSWYSRSQFKGSCEEELLEGSVRVSSICPLTKRKMEYPCRGLQCTHLQCFDAKAFLELALKRRWMCQKSSAVSSSVSWKCPICSKTLAPRQLCIDKRLKKAIESSGARELEHREPGEWIPVTKCVPEEVVDVIDLTDDG